VQLLDFVSLTKLLGLNALLRPLLIKFGIYGLSNLEPNIDTVTNHVGASEGHYCDSETLECANTLSVLACLIRCSLVKLMTVALHDDQWSCNTDPWDKDRKVHSSYTGDVQLRY